MTKFDFREIVAPTPTWEQVAEQYQKFEVDLDAAVDLDVCLAVIRRWDDYLRPIKTWYALVHLRFNQNTCDEECKKNREYSDQLEPKLTELDVRMKRRILQSPHRDGIAEKLGATAISLWEAQSTTYDPAIEEDMVVELQLEAEYNELTASAKIPFRNATYSISDIAKFGEEVDHKLRHEARKATWQWFADNGESLDRIFSQLVQVRTKMAKKLGFEDFVGLAYQRMCRIDYDRDEVARFRAAVREQVVPLTVELRKRQAQRLNLEKLYEWDLTLHDLRANPKPLGNHDWMLERAQMMFDAMGHGLDSFFRKLRDGSLMDLEIREGKAGGGFCTAFPSYGLPYVFANFNGTKEDVKVFTHEIGHAFQFYQSRHQPLIDYLWPTFESCEIHSMSLEFLTWPHMEKFFGNDAERFRQMHLADALLFLPYGVAVDHYQHQVYENPQASSAERHGMWQEMERLYLPGRDYGDMDYPAKGGRWQLQRHIYLHPFYYIDYTLAQTVALQLWERSLEDFPEAINAYTALCRRGGELPFKTLAQTAGLNDPFEPAALAGAVTAARKSLQV